MTAIESIIKDLYSNNMNIGKERFIEQEEYKIYLEKRRQAKQKLRDTLTTDQRTLFEEVETIQIELINHYRMEYYIMGFKMGGHFVMEILGE